MKRFRTEILRVIEAAARLGGCAVSAVTAADSLVWRMDRMDKGYGYLAGWLDLLEDGRLGEPSGVAGWTRRHVIAHVGLNARALGRLVHWAATGERTPMYPDTRARAAEIEQAAGLPAPELRGLVHIEQTRLRAALDRLAAAGWNATVATVHGRQMPAREIPWLRTREVWVHAVDLRNGADFPDFPADLLDALITDVAATWRRRRQPPALVVAPTDRDREWQVDVPGTPVRVLGRAHDLARWLTGRGAREVRTSDGAPMPHIGHWL
jgi:maleylpyruvate isomerase